MRESEALGGGVWAREIGTICPFGVFFNSIFWPKLLAWTHLQSLAVNFFFFWQILGGEKLLKLVEKCRFKIFLIGLRGAKHFSVGFRIVFRILFRVFQTVFRIDLKVFRGALIN